jgi:UDP-N-acetylmuramate dehydrogenase
MIIQKQIPLADKTWFRTGGLARYYAEPTSVIQFTQCLNFAHKNNLDLFILGQGANVLISDQGFNGLVLRPCINTLTHNAKGFVTAGAGVSVQSLIDYCLQHQLIGLEEFSGIPGTIGGSLYINIHYFEFLFDQFLHEATVIERKTGKVLTVSHPWFAFAYNSSKLQEKKHYLIDATFKVQKVTQMQAAYAQGRRDEIIRHRNRRYPTNRTCGSFFRNFKKNELTSIKIGQHISYVAYYLDKIGIKGQLRVGDAHVSPRHANMIVNAGNATSDDIIQLARRMQQLVYDQFGFIPQPECQLIGFDSFPLLR